MKNQYFADRRDLFKYDLLLDLAEHVHNHRLLFIPMLTPDDGSDEGGFTTYTCGKRRRVVYDFLRKAVSSGRRSVRLLRNLMPTCGIEFMAYRDDDYFADDARKTYFNGVPTEWLARSIIFLDPDIGIETGTPSYMRRSGPEKYLMYADLMSLAKRATDDSVLVVYQHLQNNARKRSTDVERRLGELKARLAVPCAYAVKWDDLAFLVLARDAAVGRLVGATLEEHARRHGLSMFVGDGVESGDPDASNIRGANKMAKTLPPLPPMRERKIDGMEIGLEEIVRFLNHEKIRATYGAVAELVGGIPQSIGARLGSRRAKASWIVNASSGMPTGYKLHERHPALLSKTEIITNGSELLQRLIALRAAHEGERQMVIKPPSSMDNGPTLRKASGGNQRSAPSHVPSLSVDDLADLRRKVTTLLNSFDRAGGIQGEGIRKRIHRLSQSGPIPREIAALMTTITEMRNSAEYDSKVLSASECAVVRHAWQAIREWAQSDRRSN